MATVLLQNKSKSSVNVFSEKQLFSGRLNAPSPPDLGAERGQHLVTPWPFSSATTRPTNAQCSVTSYPAFHRDPTGMRPAFDGAPTGVESNVRATGLGEEIEELTAIINRDRAECWAQTRVYLLFLKPAVIRRALVLFAAQEGDERQKGKRMESRGS